MPNGTPIEVQEIHTWHKLVNESYNMQLLDYAHAKALGMETRAAHDVGIITTEMKDLIFSLMCRKQQEIEEWQKGYRDDVEF